MSCLRTLVINLSIKRSRAVETPPAQLADPALATALSVMPVEALCEVPVKNCAAAGHESKQGKVVKYGND